jgi:hypothetical protein
VRLADDSSQKTRGLHSVSSREPVDFQLQILRSSSRIKTDRSIGLRPGFVDEDQAGRTNLALPLPPLAPPSGDVSAVLLTGPQAFF